MIRMLYPTDEMITEAEARGMFSDLLAEYNVVGVTLNFNAYNCPIEEVIDGLSTYGNYEFEQGQMSNE